MNSSRAGEQAMARYDTNGDGVVKGEELKAASALSAAIKQLDTNHDNGVDAAEVAERVKAWQKLGVALSPLSCLFQFQGQPLIGAKVRLVPEEFLGDDIQAAEGVTDEFGIAYFAIPVENRPSPDAPGGVQFGLYRVEVSQVKEGKETIPDKYNTHTVLGIEMSYDNPQVMDPPVDFRLD
jgi:hypothetical protein